MYLYSQAFSGRIRLYSKVEALDLQEELDKQFANSTRAIFLHTVLSNKNLAHKIIRDQIHLNYWLALQTFFWPVISFALWRYYKLGDSKYIDVCWKQVDDTFERIQTQLSKHGDVSKVASSSSLFLTGDSITAADLSFASHAELVLFPSNKADLFAENIPFEFPVLEDLPTETRSRVKRLRESVAGLFAIRLYRKERHNTSSRRSKPSKHSRSSNPIWATQRNLVALALNINGIVVVGLLAPLAILPFSVALLVWCLYVALGYAFFTLKVKGTKFGKFLDKLFFVLFRTPETTVLKNQPIKKQD